MPARPVSAPSPSTNGAAPRHPSTASSRSTSPDPAGSSTTRSRSGTRSRTPSALVAARDRHTVAAIGITDQRETTVVWDRRTGRPLAPAIVWQDRRTAARCDELRAAGASHSSAAAPAWCSTPTSRRPSWSGCFREGGVDAGPDARLRHRRLVADLAADGRRRPRHRSVQRQRAPCCSTSRRWQWSEELCDLFGVPLGCLPEVRPSSGAFGVVAAGPLAGVPVTGVAGDQQAALFGQACLEPGMTKNTYGTGSFVLMNVGATCPEPVEGLLTTVAWTLADGSTAYALEGAIFVTGAAIQWLRDGLGVIGAAAEIGPLAASVADAGGVMFVPAFTGLGSPWWDPYARGTIVGLTRGSGRAQLARAVVEAMAFQTRDVVDAMAAASGRPVTALRVDGGASVMDLLLQLVADQTRRAGRPAADAGDHRARRRLPGRAGRRRLGVTGRDRRPLGARPVVRPRRRPWTSRRRPRGVASGRHPGAGGRPRTEGRGFAPPGRPSRPVRAISRRVARSRHFFGEKRSARQRGRRPRSPSTRGSDRGARVDGAGGADDQLGPPPVGDARQRRQLAALPRPERPSLAPEDERQICVRERRPRHVVDRRAVPAELHRRLAPADERAQPCRERRRPPRREDGRTLEVDDRGPRRLEVVARVAHERVEERGRARLLDEQTPPSPTRPAGSRAPRRRRAGCPPRRRRPPRAAPARGGRRARASAATRPARRWPARRPARGCRCRSGRRGPRRCGSRPHRVRRDGPAARRVRHRWARTSSVNAVCDVTVTGPVAFSDPACLTVAPAGHSLRGHGAQADAAGTAAPARADGRGRPPLRGQRLRPHVGGRDRRRPRRRQRRLLLVLRVEGGAAARDPRARPRTICAGRSTPRSGTSPTRSSASRPASGRRSRWLSAHRDVFTLFEFAALDERFRPMLRHGQDVAVGDVARHVQRRGRRPGASPMPTRSSPPTPSSVSPTSWRGRSCCTAATTGRRSPRRRSRSPSAACRARAPAPDRRLSQLRQHPLEVADGLAGPLLVLDQGEAHVARRRPARTRRPGTSPPPPRARGTTRTRASPWRGTARESAPTRTSSPWASRCASRCG